VELKNIHLNIDLPVAKFEAEIAKSIEGFSNTIVIGQTGSGKTTQIPLIILKNLINWNLDSKYKVAITEPRRLAATSVAKYVSENIGEEVGGTVGYKIRFDDNTNPDTIVNFMTEGILLREMQSNPLLMDYAYIMIDEAHERNLNTDFILGLVKDIQHKRHTQKLTPLKIIVTSATLQKEKFEEYLSHDENEPLSSILVPGRQFEVKKHYLNSPSLNFTYDAAQRVYEITQTTSEGDILIFMPGKGEITKTIEEIELLNISHGLDLEVVPVHAQLPIEEQEKIFANNGRRKVVVATNVAETSITVPNVVYVIDSGLVREMDYNPKIQIKSLILKEHAKKGLTQRAGRAGRVRFGEYYGLYTKESLNSRQEFQTPEIKRSNLNEVVLKMKAINISDIYNFDLIDKPNKALLIGAEQELKNIGAIDNLGNITELGKLFSELPLNPLIAHLLFLASRNNCLEPCIVIASFLEVKPVFLNLTEEVLTTYLNKKDKLVTEDNLIREKAIGLKKQDLLKSRYSDFETFLNLCDLWVDNDFSESFAEENYLSIDALLEAKDAREQIIDILKENNFNLRSEVKLTNYDKHSITKTLLQAFKHNIIYFNGKDGFSQMFGTLKKIQFFHGSVLRRKRIEAAVAYEIITITYPGEKPKASARFLAEIPKHILEREVPGSRNKLKKQFKKGKSNRFQHKSRRR